MNRKALLILSAVAIVAALLAVVGQRLDRDGGPGGELVGTALLPDLATNLGQVDRVTILAAGGNEAVVLNRSDSGWVVAQQDGYPADVAKLREALTALADAKIIEEKTRNPDFYYRLGVAPIELDSAGGTAVRIGAGDRVGETVILGAESGTDGRYARLASTATSVLIDRNPSFATDPTQWLLPDLLDIRSDRVQSVAIMHADGEELLLTRPDRDTTDFSVQDIPDGRELQYATVANVTGNALRELRLQGARAAIADSTIETTSEFRTFDGLIVTVTSTEADDEAWIGISARFDPEQALAYANESVSEDIATASPADADTADSPEMEARAINARLAGWQFRIPSHIYDQMTRRIEDLLRAPETPDSPIE